MLVAAILGTTYSFVQESALVSGGGRFLAEMAHRGHMPRAKPLYGGGETEKGWIDTVQPRSLKSICA